MNGIEVKIIYEPECYLEIKARLTIETQQDLMSPPSLVNIEDIAECIKDAIIDEFKFTNA